MAIKKVYSFVLTPSEFELLRVNFLLLISHNTKYLKKLYLNPKVNQARISFHENELLELSDLYHKLFDPIYEK